MTTFHKPPAKEGAQASPLALRPREAARALGISESSLERLRRAGKVQSAKLGNARIYLRADLQACLEAAREIPAR